MGAVDRWGALPILVDTTVWSKIRGAPPDLQGHFFEALRSGQVCSSPIIRLEWLHDARTPAEFDERDRLFSALRELALTRSIGEAAVGALRDLRHAGSPGNHRVPLGDALIAATAAEAGGIGVLHDDGHFDKLATVLHFKPLRLFP